MATIHRVGFTRLDANGGDGDDGNRPSRCNIIFVHGLRGHPQKTWGGKPHDSDQEQPIASSKTSRLRFLKRKKPTNNDSSRNGPFWPQELLPAELPGARIWTYGYNADVIEGLFGANNQNSVSQHGRDLEVKLKREVKEGPIIFVAHSLGGVIVKDAIRRGEEALQQRTQAVIFLGTPHRGSSATEWAQIASNLAAAMLQDSNKKVTRGLEVDSEVLDNIHGEFVKIALKEKMRLHSFQEARGISGVKGVSGKVVRDFSSKLDLPNEQVETLDADHRQMVKCTGQNDSRYRAISGVLKDLLDLVTGSDAMGQTFATSVSSPSNNEDRADETQTMTLPLRVNTSTTRQTPNDASHFFVPFPENNRFVGRETILQNLRVALFEDYGPQTVAVAGLGGVGKTQVALQIAFSARTQPGWSVFWLSALSIAAFEQTCAQITNKLSLVKSGQESAKELLQKYLESTVSGRWLLIIDNADDMQTMSGSEGSGGINDHLPRNTNGRILFTTRFRDVALSLADDDAIMDLEKMTKEEAEGFLHKLLPENLFVDSEVVSELLDTLTYLPLAISQAAAYIKRNAILISEYLSILKSTSEEAISLLSREFSDRTRYNESRHAVATTWLVSFRQIEKTDNVAAELLSFISQIEPRAIPKTMLPRTGTEESFTNALGTLSGYAFLQRRPDGVMLDMHSLVHLAARVWVSQSGNALVARRVAVEHLEKTVPHPRWENRKRWRQYLPHVLSVLPGEGGGSDWGERDCYLGHLAGRWLRTDGQIPKAVELLKRVVEVRETTLLEDHKDRLASQHTLAMTYQVNGQVKKAVRLLEHVVKIIETTLSENHPSRLASQHELASAYKANGQVKEAVQLLEHVVKVNEALPEDHLSRLASQHQLASAYEANGQVKEAMRLLEHVVKVKEALSEDHPSRLASQHQLAMAYEANGQVTQAIELLEHVVKVKEALSEDHPERLASQHQLAMAYHANGQVTQAIELLEYVIDIKTRIMSPRLSISQELLAYFKGDIE